jgi:hypothetical protein
MELEADLVLELEAGASTKTRLLDALIQNTRFLQEQIEQAFPQCGATNNIFAIAHLLHPKYKGLALKGPRTSTVRFDLRNLDQNSQVHGAALQRHR